METHEIIRRLRELCDNNTDHIHGLRKMIRELNHCPDCKLELKVPEGKFGGYSHQLCKC
jgi:hypothetical protein